MITTLPRRLLSAISLTLVLILGTLATTTEPASAAVVAEDYDTAIKEIVFPVGGTKYSYSDTFGACRSGCTRGHEGTDIMAAKLTPLLAAKDATVKWTKATATPDGSEGNYIMLVDSDGYEYWYIHVNNDSPSTDDGANPKEWIFASGIANGTKVEAGQLIGYVGDSGNAENTGAHLHFEIHKPNGEIINPYRSLKAAEGKPLPPLNADEMFAQALYQDFLNRAPSSTEMVNTATKVRNEGRAVVVQEFANSDQWIAATVDSYYQIALGRNADAAGRTHWINAIRNGMKPAEVAVYFYASPEYYQRAGNTNTAWVTDLYRELLYREPDQSGLAHWVGLLDRGTTRTVVADSFYASIESRRTRVTDLYEKLLGRQPDINGREHWTKVLLNGQDIQLAQNLAVSTEYYQRATQRFS